jgi:cytochrome b subunit of formate dehydrogenase
MRSIIYLALLAIVGLLILLINPLVVLLASVSMLAFVAIARQMNFCKIVIMIKRYAKSVYRLRFEIRAKVHTGFRDYSGSMDSEESRHRNCAYIR